MTYVADRALYGQMAANVFALMKAGKLDLAPRQTYSLENAVQARIDLEARETTGGMILLP